MPEADSGPECWNKIDHPVPRAEMPNCPHPSPIMYELMRRRQRESTARTSSLFSPLLFSASRAGLTKVLLWKEPPSLHAVPKTASPCAHLSWHCYQLWLCHLHCRNHQRVTCNCLERQLTCNSEQMVGWGGPLTSWHTGSFHTSKKQSWVINESCFLIG